MIGKGIVACNLGEVCGRLMVVEEIDEVMKVQSGDIVLTRSAGTTMLTPVITKIRGLVCTAGGMASHLAIVSREFDIPCVMGMRLELDEGLDGVEVKLDSDAGILYINEDDE